MAALSRRRCRAVTRRSDASVRELVVGSGSADPGGRRRASWRAACRSCRAGHSRWSATVTQAGRRAVRHAAQFPADRRPAAVARARRRRGLRDPQRDRRPAAGHGHRGEFGRRRAVRRVSLPAPDPDPPAAGRRSTSCRSRARRFACSITGTISIGTSNAAMPGSRSGTGTSCRATSIRATPTTRAPARRSASTARC